MFLSVTHQSQSSQSFLILIQDNICSPQVRSILGLFADTPNSVIERSGVF